MAQNYQEKNVGMKKAKDHFSTGSANYQKFRPTYPGILYQEIYRHLEGKERAWDCATGNGQVASVLAHTFREVFATDISQNQLSHAPQKRNITYQVARAEETPFPDNYFDLITVAQALHWFDHKHFFLEAKRVAKPDAILAVWGYGLLSIEPEIDEILQRLCNETLGTYWDFERTHVNNEYEQILFSSQHQVREVFYTSEKESTLEELEGYLYTWSAVKAYLGRNEDDPVSTVINELATNWKRDKIKRLKFPIFLKINRIIK